MRIPLLRPPSPPPHRSQVTSSSSPSSPRSWIRPPLCPDSTYRLHRKEPKHGANASARIPKSTSLWGAFAPELQLPPPRKLDSVTRGTRPAFPQHIACSPIHSFLFFSVHLPSTSRLCRTIIMKRLFSWLAISAVCATALAQSSLPTVDLGYQIHQAISFNVGWHCTKRL